MRKTMIKYFGAFLLILLIGGMVSTKPCLAASAEIEISTDATEVTLGDNIFVYITINSDTQFRDFEANLTYDDDILEYQSSSKVITGSSGFLKISDIRMSEADNSRKYTLKFETLKVGICKIAFSNRAMVYDYDTDLEMSVSSNVLSVNVKAAKAASSNAMIKSLKISPSELKPAFDKNIFEYNTSISYDISNLIINALPEDEKATVAISGNDFLKEGENKVIITVLAESGDNIEYTINVLREFAPEEIVTDDTTIADGTKQSAFELERIDGEIFAIYYGKYKLVEPDSEVRIPAGYIKTKAILSDISVNAYTLENDLENDFLLLYAMNEKGETGFYRYDRIEKTLQRYITNETNGYNNVIDNGDEIMQSDVYRSKLNKAAIVIAILSVICILLSAMGIRLYMKLKGIKDDDLD